VRVPLCGDGGGWRWLADHREAGAPMAPLRDPERVPISPPHPVHGAVRTGAGGSFWHRGTACCWPGLMRVSSGAVSWGSTRALGLLPQKSAKSKRGKKTQLRGKEWLGEGAVIAPAGKHLCCVLLAGVYQHSASSCSG